MRVGYYPLNHYIFYYTLQNMLTQQERALLLGSSLRSSSSTQAPFTIIWIFLNPQLFLSRYGSPPHASGENRQRIRSFSLRVHGEIFASGKKNLRIQKYLDTCGRGDFELNTNWFQEIQLSRNYTYLLLCHESMKGKTALHNVFCMNTTESVLHHVTKGKSIILDNLNEKVRPPLPRFTHENMVRFGFIACSSQIQRGWSYFYFVLIKIVV